MQLFSCAYIVFSWSQYEIRCAQQFATWLALFTQCPQENRSFELKYYFNVTFCPFFVCFWLFDRQSDALREHTLQLWINVLSRPYDRIYVSLCYKSALAQCIFIFVRSLLSSFFLLLFGPATIDINVHSVVPILISVLSFRARCLCVPFLSAFQWKC